MPKKELSKLIKKAEKQGFRKRKGNGGHIIMYAPNGTDIITIASSPNSDSTSKVEKQLVDAGLKL